jgi:hypothetical protein
MPLFGEKSQSKREALRAERDAARAENARLVALPPEDLAAELMPAFGADGAKTTDRSLLNPGARGGSDELQLVSWLHRNCRIGVPLFKDPSRSQVLQAVQVLEHAGLLYVEWMSDNGDRHWKATQLGLTAVANGDVKQHIKNVVGVAPAATSATVTSAGRSVPERLQELEAVRASGAISDAEYAAKREQIIAEI